MSDLIERIRQRVKEEPTDGMYKDEILQMIDEESAKEPQTDLISRAVVLEKIRQIKDGTMISPVFSLMEIENFVRNTTQECEWKFDADEYCWFTDCGNAHYFESGDVIDNEHKFCPYCGRNIKVTGKEV